MAKPLPRRYGLTLLAVTLAATVGYAAVALVRDRGGDEPRATGAAEDRGEQPVTLRERFAALSERHSNRCGMPASALDQMRPGSRLQGACCFPMDYESYVNQVNDLRRYAAISVIPKDPYDIPVSLAKRLVGYQTTALTPAQRRTYEQATRLSETKGPCCCKCWRWTAFGGQAKYLITRRGYSAREIADVWNAEEGCGGPGHSSRRGLSIQ